MAANIFEIITNKGYEPETIEENLASSVYNGTMFLWINNITNQQYTPFGYTFTGLSNLSQMVMVAIDPIENGDFSDGGWSFEIEYRDGVYYSDPLPSIFAWTFQTYSIGNFGVQAGSSPDLLTDSSTGDTPGFTSFWFGDGQRMNPELLLYGTSGDGSQSPQSGDTENIFWHKPQIHEDGEIDFKWMGDPINFSGTIPQTGNSWQYEGRFARPLGTVKFGSVEILNILDDMGQAQISTVGASLSNTLGDSNRSITLANNTQSFMALYLAYNYSNGSVLSASWSTLWGGALWDAGKTTDSWYYPEFTMFNGQDITSKKALPPPVIFRLRNIFSKTAYHGSNENKYITFEIDIMLGGSSAITQELTGSYVDGVGVDFSSSAIDFSVNSSTGVVTSGSNKTFYPEVAFYDGGELMQYSSMTSSISLDTSNRLKIRNMSSSLNTTAVANLNITYFTSYRIYFKVGQVDNAQWYACIIDGDDNVIARTPDDYGSYNTTESVGISFDTTDSVQYRLKIVCVAPQFGFVSFDWIRFEKEGAQHKKAHPTNTANMPVNANGYMMTGGALVERELRDLIITTSDFYKNCSSETQGTVKGESAVYAYTENYDSAGGSSNFFISQHTAPQPFTAPLRATSFNTTSENENLPSWATPPYDDAGSNLTQPFMETTTYCNPFAKSFGNPLIKDKSTYKVNSFLAANKDAYGFSTPQTFTTIRGTILAESPHLNVFFDNRSARVYTNLQDARIRNVRFYDTMNAYVTRVGDSDGTSNLQDKLKFYYDSTVTNTPPPEIIKYGAFPQSAIDGQIPLEFTYTFDSLVSPDGLPANYYSGLIITSSADSTEELPIAVINPTNLSGTISNYIPTSPNIKIRSVTEEEWGSTVYGCEAVLDSISIQASPSGTFVMTEQYGSIFSLNSSLPYINGFNSALRIKSVDNAEQLVNYNGDDVQIKKSLGGLFGSNPLTGAIQVSFSFYVNYINDGNTITVTDSFSGTAQTTEITSNGSHNITRNTANVGVDPNFVVDNLITMDISVSQDLPLYPLDVIVDTFKLSATFTELTPNNYTSLDLNEEFEFPLNVINKNFEELSGSSGNYTKTLKVPATAKNQIGVFNQNRLASRKSKLYSSGMDCEVRANGLPVFNGKLYYDGSELDEHGETMLNLTVKGGNSAWASDLADLNLRDITSDEYGIAYSDSQDAMMSYFANGWYDNIFNEITFPLVDNGQWNTIDVDHPDTSMVGWANLKAAYRIFLVFDKIFQNIGFKINSNFFYQNGEWNEEFETQFFNFTRNVIGIAPTMKTHEDDIRVSELKIRMTGGQKSMIWFNKENNPTLSVGYYWRPQFHSRIRKSGWDRDAFFFDHCYLKFDQVHVDRSEVHELKDMTNEMMQGTWETSVNKLSSLETDIKKSYIRPKQSGFYEINISVNGDFNVEIEDHFLSTYAGDYYTYQEPDGLERLFSVVLVEKNVGSQNNTSWHDYNSLAALMYDIKDSHSIKLNKTSYDNTRFTLTITQFLEVGVEYNVLAVDSIVCGDSMTFLNLMGGAAASEFGNFGNSFKLNEVVLDMKLSESRFPMGGDFDLVYKSWVANPTVSLRHIVPDVSQLDFISEISKIFNLVWATNEVTKEITVEPCTSFYDFEGVIYGYKDWSDKALITTIEENGVVKSNLIYSMSQDSSDWAVNNLSNEINGVAFGSKRIITGVQEKGDEQEMALDIFSAMKMDYDKFICRQSVFFDDFDSRPLLLPRIWDTPSSPLQPTIPEEKPTPNNSHNHKLAFIVDNQKHANQGGEDWNNTLGIFFSPSYFVDNPMYIHYSFRKYFAPTDFADGVWGEKRWRVESRATYLYAASYSPYDSYVPNLTFSDEISSNIDDEGIIEGGLFNVYHQSFINQLLLRDKKITAEVHLTPTDIANINFRQLINIDGERYILSRIIDYNFSGEPTTVELILATPTGTNTSIIL